MAIQIFNTLTKKKEEFIPQNPPEVNIYTCGVTVYDTCHIGHARSLFVFDVIRRYLKFKGYNVKFVRNITDIDDKIITKAQAELKENKTSFKDLKEAVKRIAQRYIESYYDDLKLLELGKADIEPKATEHIFEMIEVIKGLIDKGFAYESQGSVYFSVRKFSSYGKLSGQSVDKMLEGVRIVTEPGKKDPLDFALWKKSEANEPSWQSPWGDGRPGWHIECSGMSMKYLGKTLDIHAGGRDLVFPHHENEIAQSEAFSGRPFAKYWIHHGLLTINGQKMAKSLGNFVTIRDFIDKHKDPDLLKLFFLTTRYSHPMDYTDVKIEEAKKVRERIYILLTKINKPLSDLAGKFLARKIDEIENIRNQFMEVMDDDFNMPEGLASVFDLVNITNRNIDNLGFVFNAKLVLKEFLSIFGISLLEFLEGVDLGAIQDEWVKARIEERNRLKKEKKYTEADEIRKELEKKGIILEDTKDGVRWRRKI